MKISKTTSGAVKVETETLGYYLTNTRNVEVKYNDLAVSVIVNGRVYDYYIDDLTINGVLFTGTGAEAAEIIATEVFTN